MPLGVRVEVDDPVADHDPGSAPDATDERERRTDPPTIDWSGRGRSHGDGDDDDGDDDDGAPPAGGHATRRLAATAGVVAFAYVLWLVVDLVVLGLSGTAYTSMHDALDSLGVRAVLALAWLALLYHGLDGLRVAALDARPSLEPHDRRLRGGVAFVVLATWIPTALVLCWPDVRGWFAA